MVGSGLYAPVFSNGAWVTLATCGVRERYLR
jgi:hypothetical protein